MSDSPSPLLSAVSQGNRQLFSAISALLNFSGNVSFLAWVVSAIESLLLTPNYPVLS